MYTILYIGVHHYKNDSKWRSETFINNAFNNNNIKTVRIDYRSILKEKNQKYLQSIIEEKSKKCDLLFLQRGENLNSVIFMNVKIPMIFWSTEPIQLKNDVDLLLKDRIFSWIFVHSYSCLDRIKIDFPHIAIKCSVLHNALPKEKINFNIIPKKYFAIFNRNLSLRRKWWLYQNYKDIKIIKGVYGDQYYANLSESEIAVNIHFSSKNKDDFETGIFEALARKCLVISEKLNPKVINDLDLNGVIIEVGNPRELKQKLKYLKNNPKIIAEFQNKSKEAIKKNTWDYRILTIKEKIEEILS